MKTEITHVFTFRRAKTKARRRGGNAFERYCDGLPRIRDVDVDYFCCYMPSDIILWLRELVHALPNHREVGGKELVTRFPVVRSAGTNPAVAERHALPSPADDFAARLTEARLRTLFGGEMNFYRVRTENVVFRRDGLSLTCRYAS